MDVVVFGLLVLASTICCGHSSSSHQKTATPEVSTHNELNPGVTVRDGDKKRPNANKELHVNHKTQHSTTQISVAKPTKSGDKLGSGGYKNGTTEYQLMKKNRKQANKSPRQRYLRSGFRNTNQETDKAKQTVDCDECKKKKGCHHCHKKYDCKKCNKEKCHKCESHKRCYHCYKRYGCKKCTTVDDNFCADCVSDRGCDSCNKHFHCKCKPETSTANAYKPNGQGQAYGNRTSPTGGLPTCRKCFVPFVTLPRQGVDQATAYTLCKESGFKLASTRSAAEYQQLLATINDQQDKAVGWWLGAKCEPNCSKGNKTVWYWLDSSPSLGNTDLVSNYWDNWSQDEPDGNAGMMISKNFDYSWMGFKPQDTLSGYVCEKPCDYNCQGGPIELQS